MARGSSVDEKEVLGTIRGDSLAVLRAYVATVDST